MIYHKTCIRLAKIQSTDNNQMLMRIYSNRHSHSLLEQIKNGKAILEDSLAVSYNATQAHQNPAITFLDIYPNELKSYVYTNSA